MSEDPVDPNDPPAASSTKPNKLEALKQKSPQAPFARGARLRYTGSMRLFGGWEGIQVISPDTVVTITDVAGRFSIYTVEINSAKVMIALGAEDRDDWDPLP